MKTSHTRRGIRLIFAIMAFCLINNALAQELRQEGRGYAADIKRSFTAGKSGSLEMTDINGDVEVDAWDKGQVEITEKLFLDVLTKAEAERALKLSTESYQERSGRILVDGRSRPRRYVHSYFRINVPRDFSIDISTEGGDLTVRQVKGQTTLRTSGGDIKAREIGGSVVAKTSGGNLEFENVMGRLEAATSGGNILLRNATEDVEVRTSGGDVEICDVSSNVIAKTSGGTIRVENTTGSVDVRTSGGDIRLNNLKGTITGTTSGGDVEATRLFSSASLKTSGGDIQIRELMSSLDAATSGGDVRVEMTLTDFSKPHALKLASSGGDIELTIPEKLPANIFAEIRLDSRWGWGSSSGRYDIESDFPIKIDRGDRERDYIRGEGKINGGGDPIDLQTSAGNIRIKKLSSR